MLSLNTLRGIESLPLSLPVSAPFQCICWFPDQSRPPLVPVGSPVVKERRGCPAPSSPLLGPSGHHQPPSSLALLGQDAHDFFEKETLVFRGKPIARLTRRARLPTKERDPLQKELAEFCLVFLICSQLDWLKILY